jgi:23S rRNA pseudouridine2605 synthase
MSEGVARESMPGERLQKVLARAGFGSRRACEELIRQGRVRVNGRLVTTLGSRVSPADEITLDGRPIAQAPEQTYLVLNKPRGYVTTATDPQRRPTVLDLVPAGTRLFAVGRLDADSEGLLLLTNDGDLAFRMTHPRFGVEKEYRVLVGGDAGAPALRRLREGVMLDDRRTAPAQVTVAGRRGADTWLRFVIHEGRKRQIRRMCEAVGLPVRRLIRTRVGPLRLGRLAPGQYRALTESEVKRLQGEVRAGGDPLVIAIDGPAGSGKSTLAETIARRHNLLYLDTGAMYRAVALLALRAGVDPHDEAAVSRLAAAARIDVGPPTANDGRDYTVYLNGEDVTWALFTPEVGKIVSIVSAFPAVREALVARQREIARRGPAVVVGRDIATVVLPDAPIKLYVDASPELRAARRQAQLRARGIEQSYEQVLAEIRLRDKLDSERTTSPLAVTPDSVVIDSGHMTPQEEVALVEELIRQYESGKERG